MSSTTDEPQERCKRLVVWKPWMIVILPALFVLWVALMREMLQEATSTFLDTEDNLEETETTLQVLGPEEDRRRRLEETQRKTLSPGARATVLKAHEMAVAHYKELGIGVTEDRADPFQAMRRLESKWENKRKKKVTQSQKEHLDALDVPMVRQSNDWKKLDPLITTDNKKGEKLPKLKALKPPQVEYLGVTIDAGRHHFEMDFLRNLILHLEALHYNMIHFRLSDDERFAVHIESQPELAKDLYKGYTASKLKELVAFAKDHGIVMIPEIQLPVRTASWANASPGLTVQCPLFICDTAHFVPLNLDHPQLATILYNVLHEVLGIFDTPPLLHLGGAIYWRDAKGCLEEAGIQDDTATYWEKWERLLRQVLQKLSYPEEQVVRLQSKLQDYVSLEEEEEVAFHPVGGYEHHWMSLPGEEDSSNDKDDKVDNDKEKGLAGSIISTGLDVSADDDDSALAFYVRTLNVIKLPKKPKAILVSTLYLSPDLWLDRNVLGRLLAVAMGASVVDAKEEEESSLLDQFDSTYSTLCPTFIDKAFCDLKGHTVTKTDAFLATLAKDSQEWRQTICKRLTTSVNERVFQPYTPDRNFATTIGNYVFWTNFHRPPQTYTPEFNRPGAKKRQLPKPVQMLQHQVKKTGVIFDLANSLVSAVEVQILLLSYVAPLGYDMLQLRLSDDFAFAVRLENNTNLPQSPWNEQVMTPIPKLSDFRQVVDAASEWNMEVFPEVSITTDAGGWINGGFLVQCPKRFCKHGTNIPNDIREPSLLPLVYSVLLDLRQTFGGSSPYLHLGGDERTENLKCYEEAGLKEDEDPPFGVFERKLKKMLRMLGIQPEHVLRYDNVEQLSYEDRVGGITHYRIPDEPGSMPDIREGEPFFMTADLLTSNIYSIYKDARRMAKQEPLGVMGEIRTLDRKIWKEQLMGIRLIALMLGLSEWEGGRRTLTKDEFVEKVVEICRAAAFPDYADDPKCEAAEKLLKSEKEAVNGDDDAIDDQPTLFPIATTKFRDFMCGKLTRPRKTVVMREKYVLAKE